MKSITASITCLAGLAAALIASQDPAKSEGKEPASKEVSIGFDADAVDRLPEGWAAEGTMQDGPVATWKVVEDVKAPSPKHVLALVAVNHESESTFNLCWNRKLRFREGALEVKFRAVSGEVDQGGGLLWRATDKDNYYVARMNPLESNLRVYYVQDGKRHQLASAKVEVPAGEWHALRIEHHQDHIRCALDGKQMLDVTDSTLPDEGGVGLWTKADACTAFDDLRMRSESPAPPKTVR